MNIQTNQNYLTMKSEEKHVFRHWFNIYRLLLQMIRLYRIILQTMGNLDWI